jgi:glycosyltransferase involved in cell wall biosynthesis
VGALKLTWFSNAPWANTGYGTQTRMFVPRIKADGHDIAISANFGLQAAATTWNDIPVFPAGYAGHSEDVLIPHHDSWGGDWLLTLYDVWTLGIAPGHAERRIASWTPIDHAPVSPDVLVWARQHYTIAMSKFGQAELAKAGIDARYAPHGIDTTVFKPSPSDLRARQGIPEDAFLITINAANKGGTPVRKAWSEMLSAAALFMARHSDAYLYIHANLMGIGATAPHLEIMLRALGIPEERVRVVSQYPYLAGQIPDSALAEAYTASDVLLATSMGEGFGIPVVEAQACGLPVIVTDFSAQSELCGAGWKVGYQPWFDHFQGAFLATPLIAEILRGLEAAYERKGDQALRQQARDFALAYDVDHVYATYWRPILAELEAQLVPPTLTRQQRRVLARKRAA